MRVNRVQTVAEKTQLKTSIILTEFKLNDFLFFYSSRLDLVDATSVTLLASAVNVSGNHNNIQYGGVSLKADRTGI